MGQTRFLVKSGGIERQIFSVRDLKHNGISIIFKMNMCRIEDSIVENIKDFHISVHTPQYHEDRRCIGNRIKYSMLNKDDDYFWSSIIVKSRKDRGFIWPVENAFHGHLFAESFDFSRKNDDSAVEVIGYVGQGETLVYSIFACDKNIELPQVQGFGKIFRDFDSIRLTLYFGFFNMASAEFSLKDNSARGALRKGLKPSIIVGGAQDPAAFEPFTNNKFVIQNYIYDRHTYLADSFMKLNQMTDGSIVPGILRTPFETPTFSRWPSYNDEIHENYGEGAFLKNDRYSDPDFRYGHQKPIGWLDPLGPMRVRENSLDELRKHGVVRTRKF